MWASLSPLSSPSVLRGLCTLDPVPEVHPLRCSLVCTCLGFQGTHSASPGLRALVSALLAGHSVTGLVWNCFGSLCLPSTSWALCALVSSHCLHSLPRGLFVLSAVPGGLCVLPKFVCLPLSAPQSLPLCQLFVCPVTRGYLGLPSVLQRLCALVGFVCCVKLSWVYLHATWRPGVFCCLLEVAL